MSKLNKVTDSLNKIADALNNIADALKAKPEASPVSIETDPSTGRKIVKTKEQTIKDNYIIKTRYPLLEKPYQYNDYKSFLVSKQEYDLLKKLKEIINDKGAYPEHHDRVWRELRIKWPLLYKTLQVLYVNHGSSPYNKYSTEKW